MLGLLPLLLLCGCASPNAPVATPAASAPAAPPASASPDAAPREPARFIPSSPISGGDGLSVETAVVITAPSEEEGVDLEYRWIFDHFGRFRKKGVGLLALRERHFDEFTFELPDHSEHKIYFDITSFLGKSKPKP
jgi:hypothetical protein